MDRHVRVSAHGVLIALLASLVVTLTGPVAEAADRDCGDFGSQRSAQLFFLRHGGPGRDPHRLDADHDGIACETNRAPYYFRRKLPHAGPPPAIDSTVRLSARPEAAIEGERLTLRVRVSPRTSRTVVVQRKTSSGWKRVVERTTSGRGRVTYRTSVRSATTTYRAVVTAEKVGKKRYRADVSPRREVRSQEQSVDLGMPNGALTGESVKAFVEASPVRPGRKVELQVRARHGWRTVDEGRESKRGLVRLKDKKLARGTHKYRAVVLAAGGAAEVRSRRERVRVTDPVPGDSTPPSKPTGLVAVPGDGHVDLSWDAVSDLDLATFVVYRLDAGQWVEVDRTVADGADVLGLVNGVTYTFAVSAVDLAGNESGRSEPATASPIAPDRTPPPVPGGLSAAPGDAQVAVGWDAVSAPDLAGYRLRFREVGADWSVHEVSDTTFTVTGLANGTSYEFAVSAVDEAGNESALSDVVSATPVAPPLEVPSGLAAVPGDGRVDLDWADVTDPRVIGYRIEIRDSVDDPWEQAENGLTRESSGSVVGLDNGVEYSFSVVALAEDGSESDRSEVVRATPGAVGP